MAALITTSEELEKRIQPLNKEEFVAVDTEFLRERTYFATLCLIQVAGKDDAFAIDPLAEGIDLEPFFKLMQNKKVIKVFHSCTQDIEIIINESGEVPKNVFDTQVAAQVLGYGEAVSYGNLVQDMLGDAVDKSSRHTDWSQRPLSHKQLEYALSDVTHLRGVYEKIVQKLKEKGREKWIEEELEPYLDASYYQVAPKDAWKKLKVRSHEKSYMAILASLARWREERAQTINKPRSWVLKDDAVLEIASVNPQTVDDLKDLRFVDFKRYPDLAEEVLAAVRRGRRSFAPRVERKKSLPKGSGPLMELLKVLLRAQCERHDVAPSVVAKVSDLEEIAAVPKGKKPNIPAMKNWRYEIFGQYALQLKRGELAITANGSQIELIEPVYENE